MTSAKTGIADFTAKASENPMVQNALQTVSNKLKAGKRLSKKPHKKSKWRTQKKLKI
jgi:hypothetical protein